MRGIPTASASECFGTRDTLTPEEFEKRAGQQQGGQNLARATRETFLRNEWGTRTFGFASLIVDPADGRQPDMTAAGKARAAASRRHRHVRCRAVR